MEYLGEIVWYGTWPVTIFVALKFVQLNLKHLENMEELEKLRK